MKKDEPTPEELHIQKMIRNGYIDQEQGNRLLAQFKALKNTPVPTKKQDD